MSTGCPWNVPLPMHTFDFNHHRRVLLGHNLGHYVTTALKNITCADAVCCSCCDHKRGVGLSVRTFEDNQAAYLFYFFFYFCKIRRTLIFNIVNENVFPFWPLAQYLFFFLHTDVDRVIKLVCFNEIYCIFYQPFKIWKAEDSRKKTLLKDKREWILDLHSPGGFKHSSKWMLMLPCVCWMIDYTHSCTLKQQLCVRAYSFSPHPQVAKELTACRFKCFFSHLIVQILLIYSKLCAECEGTGYISISRPLGENEK